MNCEIKTIKSLGKSPLVLYNTCPWQHNIQQSNLMIDWFIHSFISFLNYYLLISGVHPALIVCLSKWTSDQASHCAVLIGTVRAVGHAGSSFSKQTKWRRAWDGDSTSCFGPEARRTLGLDVYFRAVAFFKRCLVAYTTIWECREKHKIDLKSCDSGGNS